MPQRAEDLCGVPTLSLWVLCAGQPVDRRTYYADGQPERAYTPKEVRTFSQSFVVMAFGSGRGF